MKKFFRVVSLVCAGINVASAIWVISALINAGLTQSMDRGMGVIFVYVSLFGFLWLLGMLCSVLSDRRLYCFYWNLAYLAGLAGVAIITRI